MPLPEYLALVREKLRDTAVKITDLEQRSALLEAVTRYSNDRPRTMIDTLTGDGSAYAFTLDAAFESGFSFVSTVEHPTGEQQPSYVDRTTYAVRQQPDGTYKLHFFTLVIQAGETAYATYMARHQLTETVDTIPVYDREAVANLATAFCLLELAAYYAQTGDPTMAADAVMYRSKSAEYIALAKEYRERYNMALGIPLENGEVSPASASIDVDVDLQNDGGDRLFHPRAWR
jgi:hypothetical protein